MTIYTYLKTDHEQVCDLMDTIEAEGREETPKKIEHFNQLKELLTVHTEAEEKVFYKPLSKYSETKNKIKHSKEEHEEADNLLEELSDESLQGAAWFQKFKKLKEAVEHHIEEEENELFKLAQNVLDDSQAKEMAEAMKTEKDHCQKALKMEHRNL